LVSRLHVLEELEMEMEGYAGSVKALLAAHQNRVFGDLKIHGVLSKLIDTEEKYITAVEVALGNAMQNVVVDDEETAKVLIDYLKERRLGRVTFLPISAVRPKRLEQKNDILKEKGAIAPASELVRVPEAIQDICDNLLGAVLIVDNMDNAVAIARKYRYKFKIVTLAGELLNTGGSITGGSLGRSQKLLGRGKEIESIKADIKQTVRAYEKAEDALETMEEEIREISLKADNKTAEIAKADMAITQKKGELALCIRLLEGFMATDEKLSHEIEKLTNRLNDAAGEKAGLYETLRLCEEKTAELERQLKEEQPKYTEALSLLEKARTFAVDAAIAVTVAEQNIEMIDFRLSELSQSEALQKRKQQELLMEAEAVLSQNEALQKQKDMAVKNIAVAKEALREITENIQVLSSGREETAQEIERLLSTARAQTDEVMLLQKSCSAAESKLERALAERETMVNRLWEDYNLTYSTALPLRTEMPSVSEAKMRANVLRREIRDMGSINVSAIEEYKAVSERHAFLSGQQNDLLRAKEELMKVIADLTRRMEATFADRFQVIASEFSASYQHIMGGGKAFLRLTDPEDVLGSGIEIDIQPPGKKLQNIMLLSGGEKALCAIALFFAFLEVRPSPFCILDEIEAALDENNVGRFVDMMKKKQDKTQFIVITHRRGTMEAADTVFGVTMQEKGVSKILGISLKESAE
ncbi:MAG: AAA family ATPase, partial [Clostridia bacterium]|nr:AAA family ATPase [Clostridia bacterium]